MLNSYTRGSPQQNRALNDSKNSTILPPEITSTPFHSPSKTRTSPLVTQTRRILGPRRYSLSSSGMLSPLKTIKDPPGPLLAATNYNINVSTYIDTKSPGYASRLVQYNEESSRNQQFTHQEKYGSPGLFPIVHLFKKDIPMITPKPKKGTIRIGTPELKSHYSQEHSRLLLEGIVRSNSVIKESNHSNDASTRSVLDALKEISRKRIHASEEYEISDESHKKLRRDCVNGDGDSAKRNRVDSPTSDKSISPASRQAMKKLCTVDAVLASKTSSMYANYELGAKRKTSKSNEEVKEKISPLNKKKFTHAETQTNVNPARDKVTDIEKVIKNSEDKDEEEQFPEQCQAEEITSPPKQVMKVFDDKPLEIIRRNRLGALLSALTGQEIPPIPMEDRRKALDQDWPPQKIDKKLVSILSPQNKPVKLVEKHVTFNLPDNSSSNQSNDSTSQSESSSTSMIHSNLKQTEKSQIQILEISTSGEDLKKDEVKNDDQTSVTKNQVLIENNDNKIKSDTPGLGSFSFGVPKTSSTENKTAPVGGFKFDLTKPSVSPSKLAPNLTSGPPLKVTTTTESKVVLETDKIVFSTPPNGSYNSNILPKFEVSTSKPESSSTLPIKNLFDSTVPSNSMTSTTNSLGLPSLLPIPNSAPSFSLTNSAGTFTFGTSQSSINPTPNSLTKTTPSFNILSNEIVKPSGLEGKTNLSVPAIPAFGTKENSVAAATSQPSFIPTDSLSKTLNSNIPRQNISSNVTFGVSTGSSGLNLSKSAITTAPNSTSVITFGTTTTSMLGNTSNPSTLGSPSQNLFAMSSPSPFGGVVASVASTSGSTFGNTTTTSKAGGFSFSSGNSLPTFSIPTTSSGFAPMPISTSNTFGNSPPNINISSVTSPFSSNKVASLPFCMTPTTTSLTITPSTSAPMFGTTTTMTFGSTTDSHNTLGTDSKPFTFGAGNSQSMNNFSTAANTSSMFTLKNSQSGMTLGTNTTASTASNLSFGSTTPTFGAANSNRFPSEVSTGFGQTTTVQSFGGPNTSTFGPVTTASSFGAPSTLNFGTPNTTASSFGTAPISSFGLPSNTTSMFSSTTTPSFGNPNSTAPGFGTTNTLTFGAPNTVAPSFGSSKPTFGAVTTSSLFGTTNTPMFGSSTTSAGFGSTNTSTFGSPSTFKVPSFGSPSSPFGVTTTTSVNTFNSTNTVPPFGSSSTTNTFGGFGSTASPFNPVTSTSTFGTVSTNTFGSSNGTSTFGVPNATNNNFGSSNATNSLFGGAQTSNNTFGTTNMTNNTFSFGATNSKPEQTPNIFPNQTNNMFSNSTFGTNNNQTTNSGVFTFGSPNAQSSSSAGVFAFGAQDVPKPFNFSAPCTSSSAPALSAPAPTANGFSTIPAFGPPSSGVPNMFSIGSGTSSSTQNRGRPHARAKRRT